MAGAMKTPIKTKRLSTKLARGLHEGLLIPHYHTVVKCWCSMEVKYNVREVEMVTSRSARVSSSHCISDQNKNSGTHENVGRKSYDQRMEMCAQRWCVQQRD